MTDINALETAAEPSEIDVLKAQAMTMGITHSNNIGVEALRKKIAAKMEGEADTTDEAGEALATLTVNPLAQVGLTEAAVIEALAEVPVAPMSLNAYLNKEAKKLVRIRISCMDPKKQDLPGEFFTVANEFIGTIRKYVPFGEQTDGGYHVEQCILNLLKTREFLHIQTRTVNGQIETKTRYVKEFAIEVLPDLTRAELAKLAADQRATGRLDADD